MQSYSFTLNRADVDGPRAMAAAILAGARGFSITSVVAYIDPARGNGVAVAVEGITWEQALVALDIGGVQGDLERGVVVVAATRDEAERNNAWWTAETASGFETADALAAVEDRWTSVLCARATCCDEGDRWHNTNRAALHYA